MNQTKIEWCDVTWNPVTGCLHGCPYCYARMIAHRFGTPYGRTDLHEVTGRVKGYSSAIHSGPFPYEFAPTLHRYRLDEPFGEDRPKNIFAVSMGDLFGSWVPEKWILQVFAACDRAPWHRYLFLTKNPERYQDFFGHDGDPERRNFWLGTSISGDADYSRAYDLMNFHSFGGKFLSIEPLLSGLHSVKRFLEFGSTYHRWIDWVIIGAETGNRKEKVIPQRSWVEDIVEACNKADVPVFMKNSLAAIWNAPLVQEFPWEADDHG